MAEENYAISDYFAVLNNLDEFGNVVESQPQLMIAAPTTRPPELQTMSTSGRMPEQRLYLPQIALECREVKSNVLARFHQPAPESAQVQTLDRMILAPQSDCSARVIVNYGPEMITDTPCRDQYWNQLCNPMWAFNQNAERSFQGSSTRPSTDRSSFDSGFGTPGTDDSYFLQGESGATPKPTKKRRRAAGIPTSANNRKKLKPEQHFIPQPQLEPMSSCCAFANPSCAYESRGIEQNDSGIGSSFVSEHEYGPEPEKEQARSTTSAKRKRRARIVRPSEEEYDEKVAASLVGRLVIKQSIPKYRLTYNELLRRVRPPELFNVSALITLFRIKKDAESSNKIMGILRETGYELKKGRRMNRNVTRFSSFAEGSYEKVITTHDTFCRSGLHLVLEEAIETGRDVEKLTKAYMPAESAAAVFLKSQKNYQPVNVLRSKMQQLPLFYSAAKQIFESDRTPLAFHRPPADSVPLNPELQQKLGEITWFTHGFSMTAFAGLMDNLRSLAEANISYANQNPAMFSSGTWSQSQPGCSWYSQERSASDHPQLRYYQ